MELIRRLLVGLLGMIDSVVYNLVDIMYGLLMDIANATPFGDGSVFETFASRVYALLGLFMLFKVSFSLIKYIVNPDEFNDQMKGGKKLVTNILITLVLIVIVPIGFDYMGKIQTAILNEGIMENLILGTDGISVDRSTVGKKVMASVFTAFYAPDDDGCALVIMNETDPGSACDSVMSPAAVTHYRKYAGVGDANEIDIYQLIHGEVDGEPLFMLKNASDEKSYAINYMFIISTVAGLFTAWIFLTFCVDVAIRTVKLGFLQLIAPIPIISYIDPNSAKNGMFSKWIKEVGKTFIDLFVRLAAVYFAITLITAVMQNTDMGTNNFFAKVFIILGILVFAGQIPKLIGDLLGIKLDGNFSLNPLRKVNSSPIAGAVVGGVTGAVAGLASNAYASYKDMKKEAGKIGEDGNPVGWKNAITSGNSKFGAAGNVMDHTVGTMLGGAASGMGRGGMIGSRGKGSAIGAGIQGATISSQRRNARDGGYKFIDTLKDRGTDIAGVKKESGTTKELENRVKGNLLEIEKRKADASSASEALGDMRRHNSRGFNTAFQSTVEKDEFGNVKLGEDGDVIRTYKYGSYDSYVQDSLLANSAYNSDVDALIASGAFENSDAGRMAARQQMLQDDIASRGRRLMNDYASDDKVNALVSSGVFADTREGRMAARQQLEREGIEIQASHILAERGYTNDAAGQARALEEAQQEYTRRKAQAQEQAREQMKQEQSIITQQEYDNYKSEIDRRDSALAEARKLEKKNKEIQGWMDARKGKPKDK